MLIILLAAFLINAARPATIPQTACCAVKQLSFDHRTSRWRLHAHAHAHAQAATKVMHMSPPHLARAVGKCCMRGFCVPAAVPCELDAEAAAAVRLNGPAAMRMRKRKRMRVGSVEDPSDALWLRAYNGGGELVVLARAGTLALVLVVFAMVADGALAQPRREDWAFGNAAACALLALSALLQLVVVPRRWQPDAIGGGPLQTLLWGVMVVIGAVLLPAAALLLRAACVCALHVLALTAQCVLWGCWGIIHFSAHLAVFYMRNLSLDVRLLYVDAPVDIYERYRRQLDFSHRLLTAASNNALLRRVPTVLNGVSKIVVEEVLQSARTQVHVDDGVADDLQIDPSDDDSDDFQGIYHASTVNFSTPPSSDLPPSSTPDFPPPLHAEIEPAPSDVHAATPLLSAGRPATYGGDGGV